MRTGKFLATALIAIGIVSSAGAKSIAQPPDSAAILRNSATQWVEQYSKQSHLKLDSLSITKEVVNSDGKEGTFMVERKTRLNYARPEDAPIYTGQKAYMDAEGARLSPEARDKADKTMREWHDRLQGYINAPSTSYVAVKVTFDSGKPHIWVQGATGEYIDGDSVLSAIRQPKDVEDAGYRSLKNVVDHHAQVATYSDPGSGGSLFNASVASGYADTWVWNPTPPQNFTVYCSGDPVVQDPSKYNTAQYPTWYRCDDCANYISQALHAGGIPFATQWQPGMASWTTVNGLFTYLSQQHWILKVDRAYARPGDTIFDDAMTHVMMVSYNDGITLSFSAHTTDRYRYSIDQVPPGHTYSYYTITY